MTDFVIPPPPQPSVAVANSEARFPVRRIFCVGRNYAAHAREMGRDPDREPPFFFTKPADAVVDDGAIVPYPPETANFHFEGELVVAIGKGGRNIAEADSLSHVWGYAIGNDLTRRDQQLAARELGRPWDWGKAFDRSAICGPLHPVAAIGHPASGEIRTEVNGAIRQQADLKDLIWSIPEVIAILSRSMELRPGDLIYSGTPAGVGALQSGDICMVAIERLGSVTTTIGPPED
ncbi:MAG: fumarylacetoacetate hydrolase family protein [Rhodobacteraceae bacterium]|nr:fumarylacetoacetate hydrolase family protein [Paracoccaceae bacterium]